MDIHRKLDLEITETAAIQDLLQIQCAISRLREVGCGICLDDFGTGYSSLSQIHALSLTKTKVDLTFVTNLHLDPASFKIVKSLNCPAPGHAAGMHLGRRGNRRRTGCAEESGLYQGTGLSIRQTDAGE